MPGAIRIGPPPAPFDLRLRPPGSKSLTNRALLLAAMAAGTSTLSGCLLAEDTTLMVSALRGLGLEVVLAGTRARVSGAGGPLGAGAAAPGTVQVGTAGTVARFLLAALALGAAQTVTLDGSARMRERPMAALVDALRGLGAGVECVRRPGALPVVVRARGERLGGGTVRLRDPSSSQFVSALLLAAPLLTGPLRVEIEGELPARPYVDMTLALLRRFGASAGWDGPGALVAEPGPLRALELDIEPDASAASYFLAAAAIYGGRVQIEGLGADSCQGDAHFARILARMGAAVEQGPGSTRVRGTGTLRGVDVSLADMPDMALTLAVTALHARGPTRIRDLGVLRHHESDRLAVAARELGRLGARVEIAGDDLCIEPPAAGPRSDVSIPTYDDHRVAMAFALGGRVRIEDPSCTGKTFPGFFTELARLGMVRGEETP